MTATDSQPPILSRRPQRADARRNYDKVITAARDAFAEGGAETSLEGIARRAGVGIATLYRNFPNRQALLEAVYVEEVQRLCGATSELDDLDPWDALSTWLRQLGAYMVTKQALAAELMNYADRNAPLFTASRSTLLDAGGPLLDRAQAAGDVREDADLVEVIQLVGSIVKIQGATPAQIDHLLEIAVDGLRHRPAPS